MNNNDIGINDLKIMSILLERKIILYKNMIKWIYISKDNIVYNDKK